MTGPRGARAPLPRPLVLAAALVALEALAFAVNGVLALSDAAASRIGVGVFLLGYGAALALCAWGLTQRASWARSPVVVAQLLQLGIAWGFRGGSTTLLAVGLVVVALATLVAVVHPASTAVLVDDPTAAEPDEA